MSNLNFFMNVKFYFSLYITFKTSYIAIKLYFNFKTFLHTIKSQFSTTLQPFFTMTAPDRLTISKLQLGSLSLIFTL